MLFQNDSVEMATPGDCTSHLWLQNVESPYTWHIPGAVLYPSVVTRLLRKEQQLASREKKVFTFNYFILQLLLGYELYASDANVTGAMDRLNCLETELHRLDITSNSSFYLEVRRAQWHVTLASRACLLACVGDLQSSQQVVGDDFDPVSVLSPPEVAGLHGIRAKVLLEYGRASVGEALRWAQAATLANLLQPEWHLLTAKAMGYIRRMTPGFSGVPTEELGYLERALTLSNQTRHRLRLASTLQEVIDECLRHNAQNESFQGSDLYLKVGEMTNRTILNYRKALQSEPNVTETLERCLEGLLKLPRQFLDPDEMSEVFAKLASGKKKSKRFYNVAGSYYLKMERDSKMALRYFEEGGAQGDYVCAINALRVRVKLRHDIDIETCLMQLADRFKDNPKSHDDARSHLASFYLFCHHSVSAAVKVIIPILEENPNCKALMEHNPMFVRAPRPLNLLYVTVNQVRATEVLPGMVPVPVRLREKFLTLVSRHHRPLLEKGVDVHLLDKIRRLSAKLQPGLRPRRRRPPGRRHFT